MVEGETHGPLLLTTDTVCLGPMTVENNPAFMKYNLATTSDTNPKHPTNFGFVPLPKRLVYDPERPAHFGLLLNVVFGLSSTFSMSVETYIASAKSLLIGKYSCCQFVLLPTTVESVNYYFCVREGLKVFFHAVEFSKSFNVTYGKVSM